MGLKIVKDGNRVRKAWYCQYMDNGKWHVKKLTTPMRGQKIPSTLTGKGDAAFERSRALAQQEFEKFEADRKVKGACEHLTEALIKSKSGQEVEYVTLAELPERWANLPRTYTPTKGCMNNAALYFKRFAQFAKCTYLYEVSQQTASDFFNAIRAEYSWDTVKGIMSILKSAFNRFLPVGMVNPFASVIKRNREQNAAKVHRRPLGEEELSRLFEEASKDRMLNALTVCAACTGMRIGDVCNLRWGSIDLKAGFINVLTAKAGKPVSIPILAPLKKLLDPLYTATCKDLDFVFPDAAAMYAVNPSGITRRGKLLFAKALFKNEPAEAVEVVNETSMTPAQIIAAIRASRFSAQKADRCIAVYSNYAAGMSYRQIAAETGFSRGQISDYLHSVEELTGNPIVKWAKVCANSNSAILKRTRQNRVVGKRAASLYGWHSLRASFVVAALTHGIPIDIVRKIVGHSTVRTTEEYFNPTRAIVAEAVKRKMSGSILAGGPAALPFVNADDELNELAAKLSKLSPAKRKQLKELLG